MASGLRRLPVGRLPRVQTPGALPTKQLRTPVTFQLPPNPTLPNPVAFPLPKGITSVPPAQPMGPGGGGGGIFKGEVMNQGIGVWEIGNDTTLKKITFRVFPQSTHLWEGS